MKKIFSVGKNSLIWQNRRFYWVLNEQLWFWSDEWQAGEREVDEDIKAGRVSSYDTIEEMIESLNEQSSKTN